MILKEKYLNIIIYIVNYILSVVITQFKKVSYVQHYYNDTLCRASVNEKASRPIRNTFIKKLNVILEMTQWKFNVCIKIS